MQLKFLFVHPLKGLLTVTLTLTLTLGPAQALFHIMTSFSANMLTYTEWSSTRDDFML